MGTIYSKNTFCVKLYRKENGLQIKIKNTNLYNVRNFLEEYYIRLTIAQCTYSMLMKDLINFDVRDNF